MTRLLPGVQLHRKIVLALFLDICKCWSMATLLDMRPTPGFEPALLGVGKLTALQSPGRGAGVNPSGRFERHGLSVFDDGWDSLADLPKLKTTVFEENPKTIITRNLSPDISFDRSINPYRGCEHGCVYCYARPAHAYMGLSPGLDFESKLFIKPNAAALLRAELSTPGYVPRTIALGANTDPYQPIERTYRITRQILEVMLEFNHPVGIVTKSASIIRDLDLLKELAARGLVKVAVSVTTLDAKLARAMEPRAATPAKRLATLELLAAAGIPTVVMMGPIIPAINDMEIEAILKAAYGAGVREAGYTMLRLPHEVKDIFKDWLAREMPDRAAKVMGLVRSVRGGKENDPQFGQRMVGSGPYAWTIGRRFQLTCQKLGINRARSKLDSGLFKRPPLPGEQLSLL
jgi:DNA repair photolyase